MVERAAICHACGAEKDLALGRCGACGVLPSGAEREDALLCSRAFLTPEQLTDAQARIRRGARIQPSADLRRAARDRLTHPDVPAVTLSARELVLLVLGNVLLTPLLGYAVWYRLRSAPGPGARQALFATIPVSVVLLVAIVAWRAS